MYSMDQYVSVLEFTTTSTVYCTVDPALALLKNVWCMTAPVRGCQEIVWERFFPVLWQFGRRKGYQYVLKKVRQQDIFYLTMKYVARERQILDSIRAVCESEKATLSGRRVVLFGSRASGNERERSDFDIGIDGVAPLDA